MLPTTDCQHSPEDCNVNSSNSSDVSWLENEAVAGFRIWQMMFLCLAGFLAVVIMLCCCIRFRIPRTKQEIEADYIRKKITKKFQKQLRMIQNADMDEMDLKRALDRVRAEFKSDTESLAQSEALSGATLSSGNYHDVEGRGNHESQTYRKASDLGVSLEDLVHKEQQRRLNKLPSLAGMIAKFRSTRKPHPVSE